MYNNLSSEIAYIQKFINEFKDNKIKELNHKNSKHIKIILRESNLNINTILLIQNKSTPLILINNNLLIKPKLICSTNVHHIFMERNYFTIY